MYCTPSPRSSCSKNFSVFWVAIRQKEEQELGRNWMNVSVYNRHIKGKTQNYKENKHTLIKPRGKEKLIHKLSIECFHVEGTSTYRETNTSPSDTSQQWQYTAQQGSVVMEWQTHNEYCNMYSCRYLQQWNWYALRYPGRHRPGVNGF
jgi:hypothetical protein